MVGPAELISALVTKLIPDTFEALIWWAIGGGLARAFGKKLDWDIKNSDWYKGLDVVCQNLVARALDFTHHWYVGGLIMLYGEPGPQYWFGAGILVDDLPDLYKRVTSMLKTIAKYLSR